MPERSRISPRPYQATVVDDNNDEDDNRPPPIFSDLPEVYETPCSEPSQIVSCTTIGSQVMISNVDWYPEGAEFVYQVSGGKTTLVSDPIGKPIPADLIGYVIDANKIDPRTASICPSGPSKPGFKRVIFPLSRGGPTLGRFRDTQGSVGYLDKDIKSPSADGTMKGRFSNYAEYGFGKVGDLQVN